MQEYVRLCIGNDVDKMIKSKPLVLFSWTYCPDSVNAKKILREVKVNEDKLVVYELKWSESTKHAKHVGTLLFPNDPKGKDEYAKALRERTERNTNSVPHLFINGRYYGNHEDLEKANEDG